MSRASGEPRLFSAGGLGEAPVKGQVNEVTALNMGMSQRDLEVAKRKSALIESRMAPRGGLGLPDLLDERRREYGITDKAFEDQAVFDRVFLFQVTQLKGSKHEGSLIELPDVVKQRERNTAPVAIVVSAGPIALDSLRSHGIDLGHIVTFVVSSPFHVRYDMIEGDPQHLIIVTAGDIVSSKDLATAIRNREVSVAWNEEENCHMVRASGVNHKPKNGWRAED